MSMTTSEPPVLNPIADDKAQEIALQAPATLHRHPRERFVLVSVALCVLAALAGTAVWRYERAKALPRFQTASLERGVVESTVSATGTCNAVVDVQVGSQVSGNIKALYADFNTVVKAGQLVALIDPEMFRAKVAQAEAAWRNSVASLENARASATKSEADVSSAIAAEANQVAAIARARVAVADANTKLSRRVQMLKEHIISQEDLDTAKAAYDEAGADLQAALAQRDAATHNVQAAQAALNAAQKQVAMFQAQVALSVATLNQARIDLAHTRITAPVDGTVVARHMDVGQTVAASFQTPTIFEIAQDLTKMQIDTNVDESDVGKLRVGQEATFTVDAYRGTAWKGPIIQIRKAPINVQNVITYDAVIQANNPDLRLFPGMTANVTILIQRKDNALKVPNSALRFKPVESIGTNTPRETNPLGANWRSVYILGNDSRAHPVRVKIGISDGTFTEIEQGDLRGNERVIVGMNMKASSTAPTPTASMPRRF